MDIGSILTPDRIILDSRPRDKAQLIAEVARLFARSLPPLRQDAVETALLAREELGSTGLGNAFALPHARLQDLSEYAGMLIRLAKPIDFQAIDNNPVQLVFTLLIPVESPTPHVAVLATITRLFRDPALMAKVRHSDTPAAAYGFLTSR